MDASSVYQRSPTLSADAVRPIQARVRFALVLPLSRHPSDVLRICIPVHNEATTIGVLLWRLRSVFQGFSREYDVVVFDDASTDGTGEVLEPYQSVMPLTVVRGDTHRGYAASIDALVRHVAADDEYARRDAMVLLQGDFTESPEHLPELVKRFEGGADLVAVHRTTSDATPVHERRLRRWGRWAVTPFLRLPPVADPFTGFRLVRISVLRELLRALGSRPVCAGDGWAANIDFALNVSPFARRIENVEFAPRYDVRQRASRRRGWPDVVALFHWARVARRSTRPAPGGKAAEPVLRPIRDERPPRDERPVREERAVREDRPVRDPRPPREARPQQQPRPQRDARPPREQRQATVSPPAASPTAGSPPAARPLAATPPAEPALAAAELVALPAVAAEAALGNAAESATPASSEKKAKRRRRRSRRGRDSKPGEPQPADAITGQASADSADAADIDDDGGTSDDGEGEEGGGDSGESPIGTGDGATQSAGEAARRKRRSRRRRRGRRPGGSDVTGSDHVDPPAPPPPAAEPPAA
jgi:hypothetical protein